MTLIATRQRLASGVLLFKALVLEDVQARIDQLAA
jgi:hypothetical protein